MAVSGTVLTPLIEEYFNLEEYPEGEPLEAERSLLQIVEYLKTKCNEKGLGEISNAKEILKSQMTREERKKRNINDKVRRVLKKMHMIASTTGNTTKKRYYHGGLGMEKKPVVWFNHFYREIFTKNEIFGGGIEKTETILKSPSWKSYEVANFQPKHTEGTRFFVRKKGESKEASREISQEEEFARLKMSFLEDSSDLSGITEQDSEVISVIKALKKARFNELEAILQLRRIDRNLLSIANEAGVSKNKFYETAPFKLINDGEILKNDSTKWFTNNPTWMGTQYYGFQGSAGLVSILDNIRNNIEKNDVSKISEILKIDSEELRWLKVNNSKLNNRIIFTLALLHLNRSLLESIDL